MTQKQLNSYYKREGKRLKALRLSRGMQAKFVASCLGVHKSVLSAMEAGNRRWTPERVAAYEKAIGL